MITIKDGVKQEKLEKNNGIFLKRKQKATEEIIWRV
jgi:hypothetical protein